MEEQTADAVQPEETAEGQGDAGTPDAPYAEYLDRIPEEVRGQVEPVFKDWDANTTRKFQEYTERLRAYEPYEQVGIRQLDPGEVQWFQQFREALNDPQTMQQWWQAYATENGIDIETAQPQPPPQGQSLDEFGTYQDPSETLKQELDSRLAPITQSLEQFTQWQQQQEHAVRVSQAHQFIEQQVEQNKQKYPDVDVSLVEKLVGNYVETDPMNAVARAFEDARTIATAIEKSALQAKVNQPAAAESGGMADGSAPEIKTLSEASAIAIERLRQARAA